MRVPLLREMVGARARCVVQEGASAPPGVANRVGLGRRTNSQDGMTVNATRSVFGPGPAGPIDRAEAGDDLCGAGAAGESFDAH